MLYDVQFVPSSGRTPTHNSDRRIAGHVGRTFRFRPAIDSACLRVPRGAWRPAGEEVITHECRHHRGRKGKGAVSVGGKEPAEAVKSQRDASRSGQSRVLS